MDLGGGAEALSPRSPPQACTPAAPSAVHFASSAAGHGTAPGRRRCTHRLDGECFIPREQGPLSTARFLTSRDPWSRSRARSRCTRERSSRRAQQQQREGNRIPSVFFSSASTAGILAWHPSPRAGDTRRGILALLLRDCNLCGKWNLGLEPGVWNRWDWNPTPFALHRGFTLLERGAALFPPGPSIHHCRWSSAEAV